MKVRITDIGPNGLIINDTISLDALNSRLNEGHSTDIKFTSAPRLNLTVFSTIQGAETKGKITARYSQGCSLCLKDIDKQIEINGNFIFHKKAFANVETKASEVDEYFDDIGINYFSGEHIELEELIQESLILQLSQFWRPPQACDGSCTVCGLKSCEILRTKAKSEIAEAPPSNFGMLLKIAGVK